MESEPEASRDNPLRTKKNVILVEEEEEEERMRGGGEHMACGYGKRLMYNTILR